MQVSDNFIDAILTYIEQDWLRVMWNIHQEEYDDRNPFRNTGATYENPTFKVRAYDWSEDSDGLPNFEWRDLKIYWYKYCGRGLYLNRETTHSELAEMLEDCLKALREEENLYE